MVTVGLESQTRWFIHLRVKGLSHGDDHPACVPFWYMAYIHLIGQVNANHERLPRLYGAAGYD